MNYFSKIEAYFLGELQEVEQGLFEEELATNALLQKEVEAYELAQNLFGFTAAHLSEETIIVADVNETVEALINFTAHHLSEDQILATTPIIEQSAITKTLQPRKHRRAWLVAASMLLILSLIGSQFYTSQNVGQAVTPIAETLSNPIEESPSPSIIATNTMPKKEILKASIPSVTQKKKYESAKVKVTKRKIPTLQATPTIAVKNKKGTPIAKIAMVTPLAPNVTAQKITTHSNFQKGQAITYKATNSIILKPGFSVDAGTSFRAVMTPDNVEDLNADAIISEKESVVLKANTSITLKPGFHAKVGADFVATVGG